MQDPQWPATGLRTRTSRERERDRHQHATRSSSLVRGGGGRVWRQHSARGRCSVKSPEPRRGVTPFWLTVVQRNDAPPFSLPTCDCPGAWRRPSAWSAARARASGRCLDAGRGGGGLGARGNEERGTAQRNAHTRRADGDIYILWIHT